MTTATFDTTDMAHYLSALATSEEPMIRVFGTVEAVRAIRATDDQVEAILESQMRRLDGVFRLLK
jgi:hypothetical protein